MLSLEEFDRTAWHALALSGYVPITVYHDSSFRRGIARPSTWSTKKQAAHGLETLNHFLTFPSTMSQFHTGKDIISFN